MLYGFRALRFVCLNVVRSGRPEQSGPLEVHLRFVMPRPSQCSPVWKTGTIPIIGQDQEITYKSQCSPVWKTGTILGTTRSARERSNVSM